MHLLVTQTCDTEIVHHALMSNTPTCDIVFMMYKWHDGGRSVYQCPVSCTPVIMRTLLPFLILTGIWSSSLLPPDLSLLLQYSLSSAGCVLSARIPGASRPTRPYMGSRPTRPPMGSRPTGSPGGGSRPTRPSPPSGRPTGPAPTGPSGTGGGSGGNTGGGSSAEDTMVIGTYTWSQEPNGFER